MLTLNNTGCRPDIGTTLAMHCEYEAGLSIAQVASIFGVTRQSVFTRFKRADLPTRPKNQRPFVMHNGERFTLRDTGYYAGTTGSRRQLHRVIWEQHNGAVRDDYDIHHIDGDKKNNTITNLLALPKPEHTRLHATCKAV